GRCPLAGSNNAALAYRGGLSGGMETSIVGTIGRMGWTGVIGTIGRMGRTGVIGWIGWIGRMGPGVTGLGTTGPRHLTFASSAAFSASTRPSPVAVSGPTVAAAPLLAGLQ